MSVDLRFSKEIDVGHSREATVRFALTINLRSHEAKPRRCERQLDVMLLVRVLKDLKWSRCPLRDILKDAFLEAAHKAEWSIYTREEVISLMIGFLELLPDHEYDVPVVDEIGFVLTNSID